MSAGTNLDLMSSDETIIIPKNITKIGEGAFSHCSNLSIGALWYFNNIESLHLPSTLSSISG